MNTLDKNIMMELKRHQGSCTVSELHKVVPDLSLSHLCDYITFMRKKFKRKTGGWITFEGDAPKADTKVFLDMAIYVNLKF